MKLDAAYRSFTIFSSFYRYCSRWWNNWMESIVHMRVLKTRSYLDSAGSASRIDSDERRYFSVPIRLYLFIYFYLDDLHFSDKGDTRKCLGEISEIYIYVSQSPRSRELGFSGRYFSVPFCSPTEYRDLEVEWFIFRGIIDYFQE